MADGPAPSGQILTRDQVAALGSSHAMSTGDTEFIPGTNIKAPYWVDKDSKKPNMWIEKETGQVKYRAVEELLNHPKTVKSTWEIPPEAPPGWGQGKEMGENYLIEHCGLFRPENPLWHKVHPEGLDEYLRVEREKEEEHREYYADGTPVLNY